MKIIKCEMCQGTNIIKQEGIFVCQNCGCKYTPEEAHKLLAEDPVQVVGTVRVEGISTLDNLLVLANRYEDNREYDQAIRYLQKALEIDSSNVLAVQGLERLERKIKVCISRKFQLTGSAVKITIYINSEFIGAISLNKTISFELPPGTYDLSVSKSANLLGGIHASSGNLSISPNDVSIDIQCWFDAFGKARWKLLQE